MWPPRKLTAEQQAVVLSFDIGDLRRDEHVEIREMRPKCRCQRRAASGNSAVDIVVCRKERDCLDCT